ncbi:Tub-domain-containing protein [Piromyces finnis]|uniref:Tub-domain-containing protein n=1 Tax=Piromyces finnis TaxID=1754191 RepID=A0A1Y1V7H5_9FUNG|nr:Tub-domain-containing protein [Piromyces finnis]|eukprot:ORX48968.1 Tub-domain-containing protein [Piromyces finnis]
MSEGKDICLETDLNEGSNSNVNDSKTDIINQQENEMKTCKESKEKENIRKETKENQSFKDKNDNIHNESIENSNSKIIFHSDNSQSHVSSEASLSSLNSSTIKDSKAVTESTTLILEKKQINNTFEKKNTTSHNISKAKPILSTTLETASSSVIVSSENDATSSVLNIKNSVSSHSLNNSNSKSQSSHHEQKKKSKGKSKAKGEEEQEIDEIRNSAANLSETVDEGDEFMGLASSNITNINNDNAGKEDEDHKKNGKNKSKNKDNKNNNKIEYGKGPSAVVEGPFTVFHSSSSSSSLEFLLESAAAASSSHHNDEPPLNIHFNHNLPNTSHQSNNSGNNDSSDRVDIERLAESSSSSLLGLRYTPKNLEDIILKPVSLDQSIKCTLIRSKVKNIPSYELYIEHTDSTFSLLLYSRKVRIGNHNEYVITRKVFTTSVPDESEIIGRLKSNFVGTAFVLYDNNKKYVKKDNEDELRAELGAVLYEPNILGFKGPRKMKVITTRLDENGDFIPCKPHHAKETLIERSKDPFDKEMLVLYNKSPQWNEETQSYVLNFNHRVRIASVKNFQIVNNDDLDYIIMQFGKKKKNIFTLDFRYPFSALLAFAIALTSLDTKIACE